MNGRSLTLLAAHLLAGCDGGADRAVETTDCRRAAAACAEGFACLDCGEGWACHPEAEPGCEGAGEGAGGLPGRLDPEDTRPPIPVPDAGTFELDGFLEASRNGNPICPGGVRAQPEVRRSFDDRFLVKGGCNLGAVTVTFAGQPEVGAPSPCEELSSTRPCPETVLGPGGVPERRGVLTGEIRRTAEDRVAGECTCEVPETDGLSGFIYEASFELPFHEP